MLTIHLISSDLKLATLKNYGNLLILLDKVYKSNKLSILKLIIISSLHSVSHFMR